MNLTYTVGLIASIPLLPILYLQGKRLKASIPTLPEVSGGEGMCSANSHSSDLLKMLIIGESTIAGIGVSTHEEGFSGTLAAELSRLLQTDIHWKVYAKSGYNARQVRQDILPTIVERDIDLIVIGIGGNDAFELNSPSRWRKEVSALIEELTDMFPKAHLVFCSMPPIKEFPAFTTLMKWIIGNLGELLGEELAVLVQQYDRVYFHHEVNTMDKWIAQLGIEGTVSDFFSDGVHPSKLAYQSWARALAMAIMEEEIIPLR